MRNRTMCDVLVKIVLPALAIGMFMGLPALAADISPDVVAGSNSAGYVVAGTSGQNEQSARPTELSLIRSRSFKGDLRHLPYTRPVVRTRIELEPPAPSPTLVGNPVPGSYETAGAQSLPLPPSPNAPAPPPNGVFEGLDRFNWGAGSPPDTNGDVGPNNYIQAVNTSIGIFRKSDGFSEAAFTLDTFMSQGNFGNLCDTNNFGDPVVLYDTFEDRWIIADFAFRTDASGNVLAPAYECIAASMSGDPLTGGWNFYSIQISDNLNDYAKFGIWPDGLYMSANLFTFGAGSSSKGVRVWAINKAQMYAGSPTAQIVSFDAPSGDFTLLPGNARLQAGTPPAGTPNYFVSTWQFLNALSVYKFHVDWDRVALSTFTGPDVPMSATSWPNASVPNVPQPGTATLLDALQIRAMMQNQYTNYSGVESLWVPHTVRRANTTGFAAPRWYQANVTGGTVAGSLPQAATWDPDGANVTHRWMPSLALDRAGNMAMGYSTSSSTTFPSMAYAGRLATDPANTFSQTEQTFFTGTGSQTGSSRWGDYSSMTLDPDGCRFWYTNEYANPADQTTTHRWLTKFGSIGPFPGCTPVGAGGSVSGVVTRLSDSSPIAGATVALGVRSTTTAVDGGYNFPSVPAGMYPSVTGSFAGYASSTVSNIAVTDGNTTTRNLALAAAPQSACISDTTQSDFFSGVSTNIDLAASPGDVTLLNAPSIDQQNTAGTTTGTGFGTPAWTGQTFIAAVTGQLVKAEVQLFCNGCGATPPNLTLSIRATSGGLPTGADLASTTILGSTFASGGTVKFAATFGSPVTLTSGTQYALILRPVSAPAGSGYFWIRSSPSTYASGSRVLSADSGSTWSSDATRDYNFKTYIQTGYSMSGELVSARKDANPAYGFTPVWSALSWNAALPANTSVALQAAASNAAGGPFNFVGPDGTASTYFTTSGASLSQFNGLRYLKYKAYLATTDNAVTPVLNNVGVCFDNLDTTSPGTSITAMPSNPSSNSGAGFSFTGADIGGSGVAGFECDLDGGGFGACTSPQNYTGLSDGSHTFQVRAVDGAGNKDLSPASFTWFIDTVAPTMDISGPSVPITISGPVSYTVTYGDTNFVSSTLSSGDIALSKAGTAGAATIDVTGTGMTRTVTLSGISGAGTIGINVGAGTATDIVGHPAPAGGPSSTFIVCSGAAIAVANNNDSGPGSLRQAIADICPDGTISFDSSLSGQAITLTSGELVIGKNVSIAGLGASGLTVSGNHASGVFRVNAASTLTLNEITVADGYAYRGGGIYNSGTLNVTNMLLNGNSATNDGGGIYNNNSSATVTNVTFSGNSAENNGGGMYNNNSSPSVTNVTFSGNSAANNGGGMYNNNSSPTLINCILWGGSGGAITNYSGSATIQSSIVQGGCPAGSACSQVISSDPLLGPAGNYGGSTQTIPLLPGSSAIDAGDAAACAGLPGGNTDQRGKSRVGACDIGAFESQGFTLSVSGGNNQSAAINAAFANPLHVAVASLNAAEPVSGGIVAFTAPSSGTSAVITGSPAAIVNGAASVTATANGTIGSYNVTAATSGAAAVNFNLVNTQLSPIGSVSSLPNPSVSGQPVVFTATVTGSSPVPTGTVTFMDGATTLGIGTLSGGAATYSTSGLSVGSHTISAVYSGDTNYAGGPIAAAITQTVNAVAPTAVPTMNDWGMIIFMILAGFGAVFYLIKRTTA